MTSTLKYLALCTALSFTSCGGKQDALPLPNAHSHLNQAEDKDSVEFPSESALCELDKIPLTPGTLKMSVGEFLTHIQEVLETKRQVMVRLIVPPATLTEMAELMKKPCESMVMPSMHSGISTEGNLFGEISATLALQFQYDHSTVFLRCRDDVYYAKSRIGR
jgi:hypothetical protein